MLQMTKIYACLGGRRDYSRQHTTSSVGKCVIAAAFYRFFLSTAQSAGALVYE